MNDKYKSAASRYKNQRDELAEFIRGLHRQYLYHRETLKELADEINESGIEKNTDGRWSNIQNWLDKSEEYYPTLPKLAEASWHKKR